MPPTPRGHTVSHVWVEACGERRTGGLRALRQCWGGADRDHGMTGILGARTFQLCAPQLDVKYKAVSVPKVACVIESYPNFPTDSTEGSSFGPVATP